MHYHLDTLFDLIHRHQSNHLLEAEINHFRDDITRQARIAHLSQTQEKITTAQRKKLASENKLAHAIAAQQFLLWRTTRQNSPINYGLIATWADSDNCKLNDKLTLAIQSWLQHFSQMLATQEPAIDLIPLALNYFYEPQKLTAFLMWLLSKNTTPKQIIESNLLQRFFLMHMISMEAKEDNLLDALYKNLNFFSAANASVKRLFTLAKKTVIRLASTCNFEIITNNKKHYESHTLLAPLFESVDEDNEPTVNRKRYKHRKRVEVISLSNLQKQPVLTFVPTEENISALYDLFEIDFVHALNLEIDVHTETLEWILKKKQVVIPTLLQQIKNNHIVFKKAIKLVEIMDISNPLTILMPPSSPPIQLYFLTLNSKTIPDNKVIAHIDSLISIDSLYSLNELLLLVEAFKTLQNQTNDRPSFDTKSLHTLQKHIFEHALKRDIHYNDELENAISELPDLSTLCDDKIKELRWSFDAAFSIQNPFDSLRNKWSELLPIVNFLKWLSPEIVNYPYPFSIYQLWSEVLKKTWLYTQENEADFNLAGFIENYSHHYHDECNLKRILLESLTRLHIPELLQKISTCLDNRRITWWKEHWEDRYSVLEKAIKQENNALLDIIINNHFEADYTETLSFAINCGNLYAIQHLLAMEDRVLDLGIIPTFYRLAIESEQWSILRELTANKKTHHAESINHLFTQAKKTKNWLYIKCLLPHIRNKNEVTHLLHEALADNQWDIVKSALQLSGENKPKKNAVCAVIDKALEQERWDILLLLITLESDIKISQVDVSSILGQAIKDDHWDIVLKIVSQIDNPADCEALSYACEMAIAKREWSTLRALLSLPNEIGPDADIRQLALIMARKNGVDLSASRVSNGPGLFSRSATSCETQMDLEYRT